MLGGLGAGKSTVLVNPAYEGVTSKWFDWEYWGNRANQVSSGGRGSAWFISSELGELVLRHYRRGGFAARISECHYLFTGPGRVRSFSEFYLLAELYNKGLPVPRPVAAWFLRSGPLYRAAIIIERIVGAVVFGAVWREISSDMWFRVGQVIRRFHDTNVNHADLNCFNILLKQDLVYLIDFDKSRYSSSGNDRGGWKRSNLDRLYRSLEHEIQVPGDEKLLRSSWASLEKGYFQPTG